MLDKIQLLLSLQVFGFCIFGGVTLLLRSFGNRAKKILGWSMLLWALLAGVRLSVNLYVENSKEVFNPAILMAGCLVMASMSCYVIEVLRPGYLTLRRFLLYLSPLFFLGLVYFCYRLSGSEVHLYYSLSEVYAEMSIDMLLRSLLFLLTLFYMLLPICLLLRYSKEYTLFLKEYVSDPEDYELDWLRKIMLVLSVLYLFYLVLLFTNSPILYVVDKASILFIWYYMFYKALFLKVIPLGHTFEKSWDLPYQDMEEEETVDTPGDMYNLYAEQMHEWFEREKPYLREDLRLTDLQQVFPISRSYLSRLFNQELGCSFSDYVNSFRIEESKRLIESEPECSIQEIAERSGFHSISTFRRAFIKHTGVIPSEYRKG